MKSVLAFWVRSRTRSSCAARCKAPSRNGIKHSPNSSLRGIPCPLIGVHFRAYRLGPCSEIEIEEALHGTQQRQNLVGRFGGRRGLERVELFYLPLHHRPALRHRTERRMVPENATLSLLHRAVDHSAVYPGDRGRASLRLGASGPWTRPRHGAQSWFSGGLLRGLPGKLRTGVVVRRGPCPSCWLDDRDVAGRHPGRAGRGFRLQRIITKLKNTEDTEEKLEIWIFALIAKLLPALSGS